MANGIKRIDYIRDMAIYKKFSWSSSCIDNNEIAEFASLNFFYGWNYSGKTTLSRLFRAFETGVLSEKYALATFALTSDDNKTLDEQKLKNHNKIIRVFNQDFVKENLRFFTDDQQSVKPFAILGSGNAEIMAEIQQHQQELGNQEDNSGLEGKAKALRNQYNEAESQHENKSKELDKILIGKATSPGTGIKYNSYFGDINYTKTKLAKEIEQVSSGEFKDITPEEADTLRQFVREEAKPVIPPLTSCNLQYEQISREAKTLAEKKIEVLAPIRDLLNDVVLASWVRQGRTLHEGRRSQCGFCGGHIPMQLWEKLDKHFNQASEDHLKEITALSGAIDKEIQGVSSLLNIRENGFYKQYQPEIKQLTEKVTSAAGQYVAELKAIKCQLEEKYSNVFNPLTYGLPAASASQTMLKELIQRYEALRNESNQMTETLTKRQDEAKIKLRLHEVRQFARDIGYPEHKNAIGEFRQAEDDARKALGEALKNVEEKKGRIQELEAQLEDTSAGAARVNDYLKHYFQHDTLSLRVIKETDNETGSDHNGCRFEIMRGEMKAFHLSEGECNLIAFCYFMARLNDSETQGKAPIIWIDDPVSSLDANHIFFIYGLIHAELFNEKESTTPEQSQNKKFSQLFISTHNLEFLKYLKRLPGALNKEKARYFIISRLCDNSSTIKLMPDYLKKYITEFNYLFHKIYQCAYPAIENSQNTTGNQKTSNRTGKAECSGSDDYSSYYSFGNHLRKFLEMYLYYKYPSSGEYTTKLHRFFKNDCCAAATSISSYSCS